VTSEWISQHLTALAGLAEQFRFSHGFSASPDVLVQMALAVEAGTPIVYGPKETCAGHEMDDQQHRVEIENSGVQTDAGPSQIFQVKQLWAIQDKILVLSAAGNGREVESHVHSKEALLTQLSQGAHCLSCGIEKPSREAHMEIWYAGPSCSYCQVKGAPAHSLQFAIKSLQCRFLKDLMFTNEQLSAGNVSYYKRAAISQAITELKSLDGPFKKSIKWMPSAVSIKWVGQILRDQAVCAEFPELEELLPAFDVALKLLELK